MVWRPAHKVRGGEGRSHIVCSCCYLRGACPRACERNVPERIFTHRSLTDDSEVVRSIITAWASSRLRSKTIGIVAVAALAASEGARRGEAVGGRGARAAGREATMRLTLHT